MKSFSINTQIKLADGKKAIVRKLLGSGGQGSVHLVDVDGQPKALKWYNVKPTDRFCKNLSKNISEGSPSPIFLWPESLTREKDGGIGYIMPLCPEGFYEFSKFRLMKVRFSNLRALLTAAIETCEAFRRLHAKGLSYQDLNDGGFFINPNTGEVKVCDCDNVFPHGESSGIVGKARYIAPEVVMGKNLPDSYSDRFSMAVMLFMYFCIDHPFEGKNVVKSPCLTEDIERSVFGKDVCFIFNPTDDRNRPVANVHGNSITMWRLLPQQLKDTFIKEFSNEKINNPQQRITELEWKNILIGIRDTLVHCHKCGDEAFLGHICLGRGCKSIPLTPANYLKGDGRKIPLSNRNIITFGDKGTDCKVVSNPKNPAMLLLQNLMAESWKTTTPSGKIVEVVPRSFVPIKPDMKISLKVDNINKIFQII